MEELCRAYWTPLYACLRRQGHSTHDAQAGEYEAVARALGMAPGTVAVTVHRLRSRLQEPIRAEAAQTVASSEQVNEELKHLMDVWQR
jgi:hypothetical protein